MKIRRMILLCVISLLGLGAASAGVLTLRREGDQEFCPIAVFLTIVYLIIAGSLAPRGFQS